MPNINEMIPSTSKYVSSSEIGQDGFRGTIQTVAMEDLNGESKVVVYFNEAEKGWVLNKTNAGYLEALYGSETDNWIGKHVALKVSMVEFQGKVVPGIRVDYEAVQNLNTQNKHQTAQDMQAPADPRPEPTSEAVPF